MPNTIDRLATVMAGHQLARLREEAAHDRVTLSLRGPSSVAKARQALEEQFNKLLTSDTLLLSQDWSLEDGGRRDSEELQFIFERALSDLAALFAETNLVDEIIKREAWLLNGAVRALGDKLRLLETAERAVALGLRLPDGTALVVVEDGRAATQRLPRNAPRSNDIHVDPKLGAVISPGLDMVASQELGGLVIPRRTLAIYTPSAIIELTGADALISERFGLGAVPVTTPSEGRVFGRIEALIDGRLETYYKREFVTDLDTQKVRMSFMASFGGATAAINSLTIDPTGSKETTIEALYYIDIYDSVSAISFGGDRRIYDKAEFTFETVNAKALIISISTTSSEPHSVNGVEKKRFSLGFDEIWIRRMEMMPRGVYASEVKEMKGSGLYFDAEVAAIDASVPLGKRSTTEYWLHYMESSSAGVPIFSTKVPLLPSRSSASWAERIFFRGSDKAALSFIPVDGSFSLMMDGEELTEGDGYILRNVSPTVLGTATVEIPGELDREAEYIAIYDVLHKEASAPALMTDASGTFIYRKDGSLGVRAASSASKTEVAVVAITRASGLSYNSPIIKNLILAVQP